MDCAIRYCTGILSIFILSFIPLTSEAVQSFYNPVSKNLTIVEVTGKLRGSGVIVNLNGSPVVLTNSHIVQDASRVRVRFPKEFVTMPNPDSSSLIGSTLGFETELPVLINNPLFDFAILSFTGRMSEMDTSILRYLGSLSGNLCLGKECKNGWQPNDSRLSLNSELRVVLDGERKELTLMTGLGHRLVNDTIISGEKIKVFQIPIYSRPGVSGGGYYTRGILAGLLTKVSLSGMPETYAMPLDEIGKALNGSVDPRYLIRWENGELHAIGESFEIIQQPASNGGGETGNGGGGETGNGGGETGNGGGQGRNLWSLFFSSSSGTNLVTTWNPFIKRNGDFILNGKRVLFFKIYGRYQLPDLAIYHWSLRNRKEIEPFFDNDESLRALEAARRVPMTSALCGRTYQSLNKDRNIFMANTSLKATALDDSLLFVLPSETGSMPRFEGRGASYANWKEGQWYRSWFTAAQRRSDFLFDFVHSERDPTRKTLKGYNYVADFSFDSIRIVNLERPLELGRIRKNYVSSMQFVSADEAHRVAYIFDGNDLAKIERVYIQNPMGLAEFGPCQNFVGIR